MEKADFIVDLKKGSKSEKDYLKWISQNSETMVLSEEVKDFIPHLPLGSIILIFHTK